jgi:hypothetical protein
LKPTDPISFGVAFGVMAITGLLASFGPVQRAVTIDPVNSLRHE